MNTESLWAIQGKRSVVKCVLNVEPTWVELVVLQDEDVAVRETFPAPEAAKVRAKALHDRLLELGWHQTT